MTCSVKRREVGENPGLENLQRGETLYGSRLKS